MFFSMLKTSKRHNIAMILFTALYAFGALSIEEGLFNESAAISMQQIAATFQSGRTISETDSNVFDKTLPFDSWSNFSSTNAPNGIKFDENSNDSYLGNLKIKFLRSWSYVLPYLFFQSALSPDCRET